MLQLFTGRGTDIDDLTANTIGGLCGYAVFLIVYSIIRFISGHKAEGGLKKITAGVLILAIVSAPYALLPFLGNRSKYGNIVYYHFRPEDFSLQIQLSDEEVTMPVYQYQETESLESLQKRLMRMTGFEGEFTQDQDGDWILRDGRYTIYIFSYGRWSVNYNSPQDSEEPPEMPSLELDPGAESYISSEQNVSGEEPPDEETMTLSAWKALENFGISKDDVAVSDNLTDRFNDGYGYLEFEPVNHGDQRCTEGTVVVAIDHEGSLVSIDNGMVSGVLVETTECISQSEALDISKDVGGEVWGGTCTVKSVRQKYQLIEDTGYLVPGWLFEGEIFDSEGNSYEWKPFISAVN